MLYYQVSVDDPFISAIKVLYCDTDSDAMDNERFWCGDKNGVERLYYPLDYILELLAVLKSTTALLPYPYRTLSLPHPSDEKMQQDFQVGFLPRTLS
jgi:hypothetical protein